MKKYLKRDRRPYMMTQDGSMEDSRKQAYLTEALFMEYTAFYIINLAEDRVVAAHLSDMVKDVRTILNKQLPYSASYTMYVQTRVALEDQRRMLEIGRIEHIREELTHSRSFARTFLRDYGGVERYTEVIFRKMEDEDLEGPPEVIFMAFRENDDEIRARMESASAEIETIHAALGSGSWKMEFNRAGEIVACHWSDTFRRMLGYSKEEFPDEFRSVVRVWQVEEREAVMQQFWGMVHDMTGYATYDFSHRMLTKDRGVRWFRAVARIIRRKDGTPMTLHGAFMDIDDDVRLHRQLEEQKQALEEQKKALERALAEAQMANRAKTAFLANMSHDVRTPMNAIMGYTAIADAHLEDRPRVHDCLQKIGRAGEHLLTLINEILDMSCAESGKLRLEVRAFSMRQLLSNVGELVGPLVAMQGLELVMKVGRLEHELVYLDSVKCERVLLNLIGNAVKFTSRGGSITVSLEEREPAEGSGRYWYRFRVTDTGVGMSEEFLPHLFEPFERESTSTDSRVEGSGLGLSIAESLVELMEGNISVDSIKGKGTTFTVQLPLVEARIEDEAPLAEAAGGSGAEGTALPQAEERFRGARILLVEDIAYNREIAQDILEEAGFVVETAENGHEAWEAVRAQGARHYDLILMDIQMPVMNGYEAAQAIRLLDGAGLEELPILALSANAFAADRERSLAYGMNGHISKPVNLQSIVLELEKAMQRRKGKR